VVGDDNRKKVLSTIALLGMVSMAITIVNIFSYHCLFCRAPFFFPAHHDLVGVLDPLFSFFSLSVCAACEGVSSQ